MLAEWELAGEDQKYWEKTCPNDTSSTTDRTRPDLGWDQLNTWPREKQSKLTNIPFPSTTKATLLNGTHRADGVAVTPRLTFGRGEVHSFIPYQAACGARGSVVGWGATLQAGRSRVRVPIRWIFFNWPIHSSRTMAVGSPQPLTEMSTRNLPRG
jgi:hypothetical protein